MSDAGIAFLFSTGATAWVYSKLMRTTGGNTGAVLATCAMVFVLLFVFMWMFIGFVTGITD